MSFSGGGGTLALPSPTSVHGDPMSSVRSLRRSISRSPSKFQLVRAGSHVSHTSPASDSSSCSFPSPSPASPCPTSRHMAMDAVAPSAAYTASPLAASSSALSSSTDHTTTAEAAQPPASSLFTTPLRSGLKLSLRSARPKTTSSKPVAARTRASPRSPLKRALSVNANMDNAKAATLALSLPPTPTTGPTATQSEPVLGKENSNSTAGSGKFSAFLQSFGSSARSFGDKPMRHSMHLDLSGNSRADSLVSTFASPLKRSDATMDFDQKTFGSPVAKRRSLHGFSGLGSDANAFNFASPSKTPARKTSFEIHDDTAHTPDPSSTAATASFTLSSAAAPLTSSPAPEPVAASTTPVATPRRASTLRKSTLQQRHDPRSSWGRRQGEKYLALQQQLQQQQQQHQQQQSQTLASKRSSGEWLFATPHIRNKPRASLDQLLKPEPRDSPFKVRGSLPNASQHPFDRAPAAPAAHQPHPLSRTLTTSSSNSSLPDDSPTHFPVPPPPERRPTSIFARSLPLNAHRPRPEPMATPQYKAARPLQSVFASAGLVSKMHRNVEDESMRQAGGGRAMVMPDTPCKKQVYPSNTYPPSSGSGGRKQHRRFFFSSGSETPFGGGSRPRGSTNNTNENVVNFFKLRTSHNRRGSLLSIDGDANDMQATVDGFDLPPTPTKSVLAKNIFGTLSKSQDSPLAFRDLNASASAASSDAGSSPIPAPRPSAPLSIVTRHSLELSNNQGSDGMSPKTPRESMDFSSHMVPPDASRLSISNNNGKDGFSSRPSSAIFQPATPTADRQAYANFVDRRVSITPVHGHGAAPRDADAVLASMFQKVECVGKGEFSQVFRVASRHDGTPGDYFSSTPSKRPPMHMSSATPTAPAQQSVFAVKKIRMPFFGQKERQARLREVAALEAVRDRENVLQIFDHWEQNGHLYIQTEFCEEGGMDTFLKKVGEHGRLDDFRIWKILLEVSQGLRYVHDAGFIHLDLKPANILVTYEGHLKIGDFGLAAEWPAPKGIEGEGDREYIGPEILRGQYDKPSDVFSLGLIVLEIACNVFLPDNGPVWVALREGDMSVVPSLTAGEANALVRDAAGMPVVVDGDGVSLDERFNFGTSSTAGSSTPPSMDFARSVFGSGDNSHLFGRLPEKMVGAEHPPDFMVNQHDAGSLDSVVAWLINPDPEQRPTVHQILDIESLRWVHARRRAPATIFEGNWGPDEETSVAADAHMASDDVEMTDV